MSSALTFYAIFYTVNGLFFKVLHHGSTALHWEAETSRAALVYVRLERSCATITWTRPSWSGLKTVPATSSPDYNLSNNPEETIPACLASKWVGELACPGLEEGFLELSAVKVNYPYFFM